MIKSIRHGLGVDVSYNENVCVIAYNSDTITVNNTKEHVIELLINDLATIKLYTEFGLEVELVPDGCHSLDVQCSRTNNTCNEFQMSIDGYQVAQISLLTELEISIKLFARASNEPVWLATLRVYG